MIKIALLGSKGMLAKKVMEMAPEWAEIHGFDLPELDLTDPVATEQALAAVSPDVIINCAAFTAVDACEEREQEAYRVNAGAVNVLAELASRFDALLVHISTDYVFDGRNNEPYVETDPVNPVSAYGRTKLAGEEAILKSGLERYLIVRTSWLYGPGGKNFVRTIVELAQEREDLGIVHDQVGCPTYTGDLAVGVYALLDAVFASERDGRMDSYGIYHYSNAGQCTWYELAVAAVERVRAKGCELKLQTIRPIGTDEYPLPAPRPAFSVFSKDKYRSVTGREVPDWQSGLERYLDEECF